MPAKPVALLFIAGALLAGCEQKTISDAARTVPPAAAQIAPLPPEALSPRDPSVPPAAAAANSPKTGADATPDTEVTRAERDKAMPLPGQANDHSTPEFAKKGDGGPAPQPRS